MKERTTYLIFLLLLLLATIEAKAQVSGEFQNSNGIVYFVAHNNTPYNWNMRFVATDNDGHQRYWDVTPFLSGYQVKFGPEHGWVWMTGETMTIISQNGYTITYKYNNGNNPSFTGSYSQYNGRKCAYIKSNGMYCDCSGCVSGNWSPELCSKCGHRCDKHTRL